MHIPRNPPDTDRILSDDSTFDAILSPEAGRLAKEYNRRYLHWSEVRNRDTGSLEPDIVWTRMKLARSDSSTALRFDGTLYCYSLPNTAMSQLHEFDMRASVGMFPESIDAHRRAYYSISSIMEESIASSQMEGAVTTTKKAKEMLRRSIQPKDKSEHMILNNYNAMLFIKDHTDQPLSPDLIKDIHRIVTDGTLDERYRGTFRDNDDIVVQDALSGEVFHQPIPKEKIEVGIRDLCDFVNNDEEFIHPVVKGIILHYVIACTHPFEDGNGRVARTLFYWYEMKSGYWLMEYLALSKYIKDHKGKYEQAYIFAESDENDITYFILYNLKALLDSVNAFESYLKHKMDEEREVKALLSGSGFNERQIGIINGLRNGDEITVSSICKQFGVSINTARADIKLLRNAGMIKESGRDVNAMVYSWTGKGL